MHLSRDARTITTRAALATVSLVTLLLGGCSGGSQGETDIRLVDRFKSELVQGAPASAAPEAAVGWDFSKKGDGKDALLGWKAGPGVADLKVVDGKLVGRTTTDFPIIYTPFTQTVDANDDFHAFEIRMRADKAGEMSLIRSNAEKLDFDAIIEQNKTSTPQLSSKVAAGDNTQALVVTSQRPNTMGGTKNLLIRPLNVAGANFAIEAVRMQSEREHRASVPSGIGWEGLSGIYRETIVSRSPETFAFDLNIPANAWLDVNLGTGEQRPVTFKVTVVSGNDERSVLERTITTPHRWEPAAVELGGLAGATTLRFSLAVDQERAIGYWGTPTIRFHGTTHPKTGTAAAALGGAPPPRGVIFLMCDTLRRDHLSVYGYNRDTSPHLTQLASQGTLFLDNISQATWTKASTPSLMTSLYPLSTRVQGVPDRLSAAATTLAEVFREAGYTTVSFSSTAFTGKLTNLQQGFEELHEGSSIDEPKYRSKTARVYVDRAVDWIERHPDTPFFMYLHVFDPHHPYEPRAPYGSAYDDPAQRDEHEKERETSKPFTNKDMRNRGLPNPEELKKAGIDAGKWVNYESGWYDGSILGMDVELGRLIERLRSLGMEKDTLLVFFGDHGEGFGEHGSMWHGYTGYGEMAGVPMLFYRPGVIPPGLKISETVRNLDLMPTVLDLSGLPIPEKIQGQSLVPLIAAARQAAQGGSQGSVAEIAAKLGWKPQPAVTEKSDDPQGELPHGLLSYSIVSDGWKLVHNVKSPDNRAEYELYHHQDDPLDQTDALDKHPDVAEDLKGKLASWKEMAEQDKLPPGDSTEGVSDKELERLRSLGYVQ